MSDIIVRALHADEFNREDLNKLFLENGSTVPSPILSHIGIAEDERGKLGGFLCLQPQYHLEPILVVPEFKNANIPDKLMKFMIDSFKNVKGLNMFCFAPNRKIQSLAERFGFEELPYKVMKQGF